MLIIILYNDDRIKESNRQMVLSCLQQKIF